MLLHLTITPWHHSRAQKSSCKILTKDEEEHKKITSKKFENYLNFLMTLIFNSSSSCFPNDLHELSWALKWRIGVLAKWKKNSNH